MLEETIYDHPHYYDVLFGWDRSIEADFYHRALERCGVPNTGPVLEVAGGTGQVAILLAQRARNVCGLDISADMVAYMRRAADVARVEVAAICADMSSFVTQRKFTVWNVCSRGGEGHTCGHTRPMRSSRCLRRVGRFECESWHPESGRATGVSEFSFAPSTRPSAGRTMVVLRRSS